MTEIIKEITEQEIKAQKEKLRRKNKKKRITELYNMPKESDRKNTSYLPFVKIK